MSAAILSVRGFVKNSSQPFLENPEDLSVFRQKLLAECIEQSLAEDTYDFQWDTFFRLWFREHGSPYFFLFKRNLGVTNTQYVELLSLLQLHSRDSVNSQRKHQLLFHTTEQVKAAVVDAINMLLEASTENRRERADRFAATYAEVFASTVAVDMFYCSCAAFLPPGLEADLVQICADAGYLHSAGHSIFVRNIKKARKKDFDQSISRYLEDVPNDELPIPFVVYAHEDFSGYDKDAHEQINRGIEHTKLYLEKMNMGSYRLSQIVHGMRTEYSGRLEIPNPGPYDENQKFCSPIRTLWLISDRSISRTNPTTAGNERYYICYEQTIKNDNPFFFFDENKPAWKSHTTLPHSLTAALLNTTRPIPDNAAICDPFGGTGTTWFEVKRLALDSTIRCSDLSPATPLMVQDNLKFFLMGAEDLLNLSRTLIEIHDTVKASKKGADKNSSPWTQGELDFPPGPGGHSVADVYLDAISLLNELRKDQPRQDQEFNLSIDFVVRLSSLTTITRFLFYVALRAELRFQGGYKRGSVTFEKAFCDSLFELIGQIEKLIEVRKAAQTVGSDPDSRFLTYQSAYSPAVVPMAILQSFDDFQKSFNTEIFVSDACLLPNNSLDVIICDPPYGFNTTEDQSNLADLYSRFLDAALLAVRDNGHLIICLPAESYTGRDLPYCTRADLITNQVLTKAQALGKMIFLPANSIPTRLFTPPYYWEAERALRRVILHFRVSSVPHNGPCK